MQRVKYLPAPEYLEKLIAAIRATYGCGAEYESTWMGVEHVGSQLWSGSVEIFHLLGGKRRAKAYAWSKVEGGQLHCFVVLQENGIDSPRAAVRHVLAQQAGECGELLAA